MQHAIRDTLSGPEFTRTAQVAAQVLTAVWPDEDHTDRDLAALISTYRRAGLFREAVDLGERTVADCERVLGSGHRVTLPAATWRARARNSASSIGASP
ncbi:tetratricopeptide repeat protein [Kitasatospora cathayae]|uniref:Tetratricopeptide repeat protein n=1 Tax=Kitasatospora cathayae TaxID=3004092 RepID=A0ABY7QIQ1_9ACTN|nr:tetratricopeptide repeat protein [Kitasatospora sp. HUAS 3-15]WBP92119.1 tetratricopeptide repeat protein [Kitasatospora sp. HUAS 3-15]